MTADGVRALADRKLLGPDFNAVHCNKLTDDELSILAGAGASFTATPEVEMQMGHGFPVTGRVIAAGRPPSIGTDVEAAVGADLLGQARFALQVQRGLDNAKTHQRGEDIAALSLTARDALSWVTLEGARALGLENVTGSLAVGKRADLIAIRPDETIRPATDPAETALFLARGAAIDTVMIDGIVQKRVGRLVYAALSERAQMLEKSRARLVG